MIKRHVVYKDELIPYYIVKSKNKSLQLKINEAGELELLVPSKMKIAEVEMIMKKHVRLMYNRYQYIKNKVAQGNYQLGKEYTNGDQVRILGELYTIRLVDSMKTSVVLKDGELLLYIKEDANAQQRLGAIKQYLYAQAKKLFPSIMTEVYPLFQDYNFAYPSLTIREMKTRWGSCSVHKAKISLNLALMQVPMECIKQVVVHEFCHFVQPNHSKKFYALMDHYMPNWQREKQILDNMGSTTNW